jgi:hypothetical protein
MTAITCRWRHARQVSLAGATIVLALLFFSLPAYAAQDDTDPFQTDCGKAARTIDNFQ